ncbi:MAG: LysM peptidoglycan-binding domain-containing protein [Chloroflexaceae bacterium]
MSDDFKSVGSESAYPEERSVPEIQEPDLPEQPEQPEPDSPEPEKPLPALRSRTGRFLAAAVMLALAVILALFAISLVITIGFGDVLVQPYREVGDLRIEQRTLQAQVAELSQAASGNNAEIATISAELSSVQQAAEDLDRLSGDLGQQIATASALQEEVGEERMNLAVIATIQVGRQEELARIQANVDELEDRTQSLVNFIERLNNLTADTTLDVEDDAAPAVPAAPTNTPIPDEAEASDLVTATPEAEAGGAEPEAEEAAEEAAEDTATATATRTPRPTRTPTATATSEQLGPPGPPEPTPAEEANQPTSATLQQAANPDGRTYVVQPGDTLPAIATQFDRSVEQLRAANELTGNQADTIRPGQELTIP